MHKNGIGRFAAAKVKRGRPEQGMEVRDVFANEVVLLHIGVVDVGLVVHPNLAQIVLQ